MSSIERAMEKLSGGGGDKDEPSKAAETAIGKDQAVDFKSSPDEPLEPPAAASVAESESAPSLEAPVERSAATEPQKASETPREAVPPAPARASTSFRRTQVDEPNSQNFINIDFERLAAAGHLIPDASVITRASEEYQQIKRRLLGNLVEGILNTPRPKNLIMVTSSLPSEGKTFTSVNLALSLTMEVDHTILAVDTDIVKRDLSRAFGVEEYRGLYDLLGSDTLRLEDLLVRTSIPNLVILPAGQDRDASTERLASAQMRALTDELASRYSDRVVLFDSPPILATTTATALAPLVGQLMIVVEAARTKQETVRDSLARLEGVRITGMILNKSRQPVTRAYDYYGYYYRPE